jgi:hypothetical protein
MGIFLYIFIGIIFSGFVYWCAREDAAQEEDTTIALKIVILTFVWPLIAILTAGYVVKLVVDKFAP